MSTESPLYQNLINATNAGQLELVYELLQESFQRKISVYFWWLEHVVKTDNLAVIDFLFGAKGFNPDSTQCGNREISILNMACRQGKLEIVKKLLSYGADPEKKIFNGRNAFFVAVTGGNVEILELLFSKTKKLEYVDNDGNTLLHYACRENCDQKVFDFIWTYYIWDINKQNDFGDTALHLEIDKHYLQSEFSFRFLALVEHPDIDFSIENKRGKTVLDLCKDLDTLMRKMMLSKFQSYMP